MNLIALVDMDGTLCDFVGGLRRGLLPLCSPEERPLLKGDLHELEDSSPPLESPDGRREGPAGMVAGP